MPNANGDSTSFQKHRQLEDAWHCLCQASPQYYIHFSAANLAPETSASITASASPPLTAKIDLLLPSATTDKVALITSGVTCDALLIGSIFSQLYNL